MPNSLQQIHSKQIYKENKFRMFISQRVKGSGHCKTAAAAVSGEGSQTGYDPDK